MKELNEAMHIASFEALLAPVTPEVFFRDYYGKRHLHVPGGQEKISGLMGWPELNRLLSLNAYWTAQTLQLYLDRRPVPPESYCRTTAAPGGPVAMADPGKVRARIAEGATLIANAMDSLSPEVQTVARALEEALMGHAQANLYASFRRVQAFDSHFDTHEVFALHTEGEKVWRIYEGRIEAPVQHREFMERPPEFHRRARKKVLEKVPMKPGDLLYIPRGLYHDALASTDACIHIAFGVISLRGLDLFEFLEETALADPLFRADLPAARDAAGREALKDHLGQLGARIRALLEDPNVIEAVVHKQRARRSTRGFYDLPDVPARTLYRLAASGLKVTRKGTHYMLRDARQGVPLPPGTHEMVGWIISRPSFAVEELKAEFPYAPEEEIETLIGQLENMNVIRRNGAGSVSSARPAASPSSR